MTNGKGKKISSRASQSLCSILIEKFESLQFFFATFFFSSLSRTISNMSVQGYKTID